MCMQDNITQGNARNQLEVFRIPFREISYGEDPRLMHLGCAGRQRQPE
jgi:hypothetical protein